MRISLYCEYEIRDCQLPEKMLLKLLIMVNFRSFLRLLLKHFPDLTAG